MNSAASFFAAGDFILVREAPPFRLSGFDRGLRALVGSYESGFEDPGPLLSLLPRFLRLRDSPRVSLLLEMADRESTVRLAGHTFALLRIGELLLAAAMRQATVDWPPPPQGLLRGLGDGMLLRTLHEMHARAGHPWTVEQLARISFRLP